jgi:hypothetical protein
LFKSASRPAAADATSTLLNFLKQEQAAVVVGAGHSKPAEQQAGLAAGMAG